MNNRRNFFKNLFGFLIAPKIAKVVKIPSPNPNSLGYKGREFFKKGIVYAPYIPILTTEQLLLQDMSREIQEKIDAEFLKNIKNEIDASLVKIT